jgi:hypothetical protein
MEIIEPLSHKEHKRAQNFDIVCKGYFCISGFSTGKECLAANHYPSLIVTAL